MSQFVELAWAPMKADGKEETVNALKALAPELASQKGLVATYHGKVEERPNSVQFATVWGSEADYQASQKSAAHDKVSKLFRDLVDTSDPNVHPYHNTVVFSSSFEAVANAPVANVTALFLPASADVAAFEAAWMNIVSETQGNAPDGFVAGTHGWATEDIEHPKLPGGKAKVFVAASGWESTEKNQAASAALAPKFGEIRKFTEVFDTLHTSFHKGGQ